MSHPHREGEHRNDVQDPVHRANEGQWRTLEETTAADVINLRALALSDRWEPALQLTLAPPLKNDSACGVITIRGTPPYLGLRGRLRSAMTLIPLCSRSAMTAFRVLCICGSRP